MSAELQDRGRQASAVSNGITRLHREHYGRGATSAQTIIQRDYVVCFLEDIYTPLEHTLIQAGKEEAVRDTRQLFQQAMRTNFVEVVEGATGRKVTAFMSQNHFGPDMACEIFVLEPQATDGAPES
jgi:uncharacterized protein YbcI